jgi:SulP family sulfate permease
LFLNVQSGGRGRLSTLAAGIFLLIAILFLQDWVKQMPMATLVAVMIMVSIGTFRWSSVKNMRRIPRTETAVMLTTMFVTIFTRNFALGVVTGIVMSTVFFSNKIAQLVFVDKVLSEDGSHRIYKVAGQIFFLSRDEFLESFDFTELLDRVTIDLTQAHLWDQGAVEVLDRAVIKFRRNGAEVELIGLNEASTTLLNKLAISPHAKALK